MDTPVLKRRLNPFLLASTVLILSLLAGMSVLYQGQLNDLVSKRKQLSEEIDSKEQQISQLKAERSNLTGELEKTENDLQNYINLYEQEKQKREDLEDEVSQLETQVEDVEDTVSALNSTVGELNESLGEICTDEATNLSTGSRYFCEDAGWSPED